jgi:hypothetical protein
MLLFIGVMVVVILVSRVVQLLVQIHALVNVSLDVLVVLDVLLVVMDVLIVVVRIAELDVLAFN